jgi:signal peptidase II
MRRALCFALCILTADQLVKWWVLEGLSLPTRPPIEVTSFFNLVMVWNHGVSFGMFSHVDARWPLVVMACVISLCLLLWLRALVKEGKPHVTRYSIAVGMVVGGALGNVIDRIRFGAVADFLDVHVMGHHWPAFNVADACIVMGVCLLLFLELTSSHSMKGTE